MLWIIIITFPLIILVGEMAIEVVDELIIDPYKKRKKKKKENKKEK